MDNTLLNELPDLRLEHLDLSIPNSMFPTIFPVQFFKRQVVAMKFLRLNFGGIRWGISDELLNAIWELKNLQTLELVATMRVSSLNIDNLNNIHRLENLRRLKVSAVISRNILDHLRFGVFEHLEELEASFDSRQLISLGSAGEINRITPNLRKILIECASFETVKQLLGKLEHLETVEINDVWDFSTKNPNHQKIPRLENELQNRRLEPSPPCDFTVSMLLALLCEWRQLKRLYLNFTKELKFDSGFIAECFLDYQVKWEEMRIGLDDGAEKITLKRDPFRVWENPGRYVHIMNIGDR